MANKAELLKEIDEVSFAVNDITLYLDTHPTDTNALQYFGTFARRRKEALKEFEQQFYPLTIDCISEENSKTEWEWANALAPWEGGMA